MIDLEIRPYEVCTWDDFIAKAPPFSIALDGYVSDGPKCVRLPDGWRMNMNHHEGVYRTATRSTCAQALIEVRAGLFERFRDRAGPKATLWVNDLDEDVCLAVFILRNAWLAKSAINPALNRLVGMEDLLDTFGGAYPFSPDMPALRELAWVFSDCRAYRGLRPEATDMRRVIDSVGLRIAAHIAGRGESVDIATRYEVLRRGAGWVEVREIGADCRTAMLADGIRTFVTRRASGQVVIGNLSPYSPFNLMNCAAALDIAEGVRDGTTDRWGGGDTFCCSPRSAGTKLSMDRIGEILDQCRISESLQ